MKFRNEVSGEVLTHEEFVSFVWEEAERQFGDFHDEVNWCDLTKAEQIALYCEQYEHQLADREWVLECEMRLEVTPRLNLANMERAVVNEICDAYQINVCEAILKDGREIEAWCWDSDFDSLLIDSKIKVGNTYNREKEFNFDDDYNPVGLDYNDYIETVELIQDGISYFFPVYCVHNGVGAENAVAIFEEITL